MSRYTAFVLGFALATPAMHAQPVRDSLPPGVTSAMIEQGSALFHGRGMCVNCHGSDATGLLGPNLTDSDWLRARGSYLSIVQVILTGVSEAESSVGLAMPTRGGMPLSDVDVQAVAAWVWVLAHPDVRDSLPHGVTADLVGLGQRAFHREGSCVRCHGADATGDLGPDLTDADWVHAKGSYLAIASTIMSGVPESESTRGIPMPPRGGSNLSDAEVHDVAAYVWYISHRP